MTGNLINFRADDELNGFLEDVAEEWNVNKSEAIRRIIRMQMGLLEGRFLSILNSDLLEEEWGGLGEILKGLKDSENISDDILEARLKDVVQGDILLGAEEVEVRSQDD